MVSSLAAFSKVPGSQLTGGQWVQRQQGATQHLVGYLRLKPETVAKILPYSGSNAVFVNKVNDRTGGPVFWVKRSTDETREAYFRRVSKLQQERQQAIIWRQGGGQDLGFGRTDKDIPPTASRMVAMRGLPAMWDDDDIVSVMHSQKWTNFQVTSRKKKCSYGKGFPPPEQKDHSWWAFNVEDDPPWTISVQVLPQHPRGPMMCQTARGPSRFTAPVQTPPDKPEDVDMKQQDAGKPTGQDRATPRQKHGTQEGAGNEAVPHRSLRKKLLQLFWVIKILVFMLPQTILMLLSPRAGNTWILEEMAIACSGLLGPLSNLPTVWLPFQTKNPYVVVPS